MAATMADIRYAFMKEFPKQTAGKSREEVKEIMKEMGYGIKSGLMQKFRKKKGLARGGLTKESKQMGARKKPQASPSRPKKEPKEIVTSFKGVLKTSEGEKLKNIDGKTYIVKQNPKYKSKMMKGKATKISRGANDYRSGGMVLNSVDNRKNKS